MLMALSRRAAGLVLAAGLLIPFGSPPAVAAPLEEAQALVTKANATLRSMRTDPKISELEPYLKNAKAVLIFPQLVKGGFILGFEGGSGVMLVRGTDGTWSPPAFVTLAAGSIGLQIGGQVSDVVLTVMRTGAVDAILRHDFKFGGDVSIAVGPLGKGLEAATTSNFNADVYSFARTAGLFGGLSLEGAGLVWRDGYNAAYYNAPNVTPEQIVLERQFYNQDADALRSGLP